MTSSACVVRILSEEIVKPSAAVVAGDEALAEHPRRCELSQWDLSMLSAHYIQKGHLFSLPSSDPPVEAIVERLKSSLSVALSYFYPLAGHFAAEIDAGEGGMFVHIDCDDRGAAFLLAAAAGITVADVLAPSEDVPGFVRDFFPLEGRVNYDGRFLPLLAVQLTKLEDGVFLGSSFNHAVGDGVSFWNFLNAWAEISRSSLTRPSDPPFLQRWFADGSSPPPIRLPFAHEEQFIERFSPPALREKMFHFTPTALAELKARANKEQGTDKISSFQALSALMWRCITRLRSFPDNQIVGFGLTAENRRRLRPSLPADYFGNSIYVLPTRTTAGELLAHDLGWAAGMLNQCVESHTDAAIREMVDCWMVAPVVYRLSSFDRFSMMMGGSPRFDTYGCDFGWGKAVAMRSGAANKFDGRITAYPGWEGGGSVDLEVCLPPETMAALELDEEFNLVVSTA